MDSVLQMATKLHQSRVDAASAVAAKQVKPFFALIPHLLLPTPCSLTSVSSRCLSDCRVERSG